MYANPHRMIQLGIEALDPDSRIRAMFWHRDIDLFMYGQTRKYGVKIHVAALNIYFE
jgi:hypothetical protein